MMKGDKKSPVTSAAAHCDRICISNQTWAVYEVQRCFKFRFDVDLSTAIGRTTLQVADESQISVKDVHEKKYGQVSAGRFELTHSETGIRGAPGQLDTLQICNKLIKWCLEGAREISVLFNASAFRLQADPPALGSEEPVKERSDESGKEMYARSTLCKYILQHAEHIAEFRRIIAHNILSVTQNECSSVLVSIHLLLGCLNDKSDDNENLPPSVTPEIPGHRSAQIEESISNLSVGSQGLIKGITLRRDSAECTLLITLEMIVTLENAIVKRFKCLGWNKELSNEVRCLSTLCALLRNELLHKEIASVTGVDPKQLTVKQYILCEDKFQSLRAASRLQKRKGMKAYSDLDIVYMARNLFYHASFTNVSVSVVLQWLESGIAMMQAFKTIQDSLEKEIEHLKGLQQLLSEQIKVVEVSIEENTGSSPDNTLEGHLLSTKIKPRPKPGKVVMRLMKKAASRTFVGRGAVLQRMEEIATTIGSDPRVIILSGHPGIGKSYVALRAAQSSAIEGLFHMQFWITATTKELLSAGLVGLINASDNLLADSKMPMKKLVSLSAEVCRQYSCYLVFDDVTPATSATVRQIMASFDVQGVAVISTCMKGYEFSPVGQSIDIEALTMEESFELLRLITLGSTLPLSMTSKSSQARRKLWEDMIEGQAVVEKIVDSALGRSPLGVSLLGQLLSNELSFDRVAQMFSGSQEFSVVTSKHKPIFAQQHAGLETTVRYLLNPLRGQTRLLSLLYAVSLLSPNGIPIRLLLPFGKENSDVTVLKENELFALENIGLIQISQPLAFEDDKERGRMKNAFTYVTIHQLTQRALRQVLPSEFGIVPLEVCRSIVEGIWKDQRLDEFCGVRLGQVLSNAEEGAKWADCVLFSRFPQMVFQLASSQASSQERRKLLDCLLLCCFLLCDLYPNYLKTILQRISSVQTWEPPSREQHSSVLLSDIILNADPHEDVSDAAEDVKEETFIQMFEQCAKEQLAVELLALFMANLFSAIGKRGLFLPLDSAVDALGSRLRRPDLINVSAGLFKSIVIWAKATFMGRHTGAVALITSQLEQLVPGEKYFDAATLDCHYMKATALRYSDHSDEALAICEPVIEKYLAMGNMARWSDASRLAATIFVSMCRTEEALTLYQRHLEFVQALLGENLNPLVVADAHAYLGHCYSELSEFEPAEYHFLQFEAVRAKLGHKGWIGHMWKLCWVYWRWGKYSLAWEWAQRRWAEIGGIEHGLRAKVMAQANLLLYLYALGPQRAADTIMSLGIGDIASLREETRKCQSPVLTVLVFALCSRAESWLGRPEGAWDAITAGLVARSELIARDDAEAMWVFDVQLLSAAAKALPLTLAASEGNESGADQLREIFQRSWRDCLTLADYAIPRADVGWHYDYARLLLWVSRDVTLQKLFHVSVEATEVEPSPERSLTAQVLARVRCEPSALHEEALSRLGHMSTADVEVTEWTSMALQLQEEYAYLVVEA